MEMALDLSPEQRQEILESTYQHTGDVKQIFAKKFHSVTQSCPTLCHTGNSSMPGLPVHHQLLESTQTHVYRVGDAIQPSCPLLFPLFNPL